ALLSSQNRSMLMLFPLFGAVPGAVAAALLFVPIELAARFLHLGGWVTPAVVLAGASIVFLFDVLVGFKNGTREFRLALERWFGANRSANLRTASSWIVIGANWGTL